ncbi:MAG: ABC transporter permease [Anaerolineae bacterium]
MKAFARALSAELLKTKRTLAFWLTLLAPLGVVGLQLLYWLDTADRYVPDGSNPWISLIQSNLLLWNLLMLPLFTTLETALVNGLEHNHAGWKHLFALPVPRWSVYMAKQFVSAGLISLSMAILCLEIVASGLLLRLVEPGLGFDASIPWARMALFVTRAYLASWLIIAIHTWVSARWSSFVVAMGVGVVVVIASVLAINSDYAPYYPWTLPGFVGMGFKDASAAPVWMLLGVLGGPVVALLGCWNTVRRDVA